MEYSLFARSVFVIQKLEKSIDLATLFEGVLGRGKSKFSATDEGCCDGKSWVLTPEGISSEGPANPNRMCMIEPVEEPILLGF